MGVAFNSDAEKTAPMVAKGRRMSLTDKRRSLRLSKNKDAFKSTAHFQQGNAESQSKKRDGFFLQLLEKVEKHLTIIVLADEGFWAGNKTGYFKLDPALTAALKREGIPSSKAGSILAPAHLVTIAKEKRNSMSIPQEAEYYAFAHPSTGIEAELEEGSHRLALHQSAMHFLLVGGYVYFDANHKVVQINALTLSPSRTSIFYQGPHPFPAAIADHLTRMGRMSKVTVDSLESKGFLTVGWVYPGEEFLSVDADAGDGAGWPGGAFVYTKRNAEPVYYGLQRESGGNVDFDENTEFEQVCRAAMVSAQELDSVLERLTEAAQARKRGDTQDETRDVSRAKLLNVHSKQEPGVTAVMWASREGIPYTVKNLLDAGASIGEAPHLALQLALDRSNEGVVSVIVNHRACLWMPLLDPSNEGAEAKVSGGKAKHLMGNVAVLAGENTSLVPRQVTNAVTTVGLSQALLQTMRVMKEAKARAGRLNEREPKKADDHHSLSTQLQLCAAACIQLECPNDDAVNAVLSVGDGREALELALNSEARQFLGQPSVRHYIKRTWKGHYSVFNLPWHNHEEKATLTAMTCMHTYLLLLLIVQLPLLLIVAVAPPIDLFFQRRSGKYLKYLLHAPVIKFALALISDTILAAVVTFLPRAWFAWESDVLSAVTQSIFGAETRNGAVMIGLGLWASATLLWEVRQCLKEMSFAAYWSERTNRIDLPAAVTLLVALYFMHVDLQQTGYGTRGDILWSAHTRSVRAIAVMLCWARTPRFFLLSTRRGPLVLMIFKMMDDVVSYLFILLSVLLAFAGAFLVLFEPDAPIASWPFNLPGGLDFSDCSPDRFNGYATTLQFLAEKALSGESFFDCSKLSDVSEAAWLLTLLFYFFTGLLLLNMLIAMMAKTFDNISEASAINFNMLLAQTTMSIDEQPPAAPPLNLLTIPYDILILILRVLFDRGCVHDEEYLLSCGWCCVRGNQVAAADDDGTGKKRISLSRSGSLTKGRLQTGEQAARSMFQLREVEQYMTENLNDEVQEGRWRSILQRDVHKHHRAVKGSIDENARMLEQLKGSIESMQAPPPAERRLSTPRLPIPGRHLDGVLSPSDVQPPKTDGEVYAAAHATSPQPVAAAPRAPPSRPMHKEPQSPPTVLEVLKAKAPPQARPPPQLPPPSQVPAAAKPAQTGALPGGPPPAATEQRYRCVSTTRPASAALAGVAKLPPIEKMPPASIDGAWQRP